MKGSQMELILKTGDPSPESGIYSSNCCGYRAFVGMDIFFPECRKCYRAASWSIVVRLRYLASQVAM